jgi:hypothetical protein
MSRSTGPDRFILGIALCLAACADDPDALIKVSRMSGNEVNVRLCSGMPLDCSAINKVFKQTEPESIVRTVAIHLDEAVDMLTVYFQQLGERNVCHYLVIPFDGSPRTMTVTLPSDESLVNVRGCDDCVPLVCSQ